jgi:hypothetical protein
MNVQLFSFLLGHSFSALFPAVIPMEIESTWNPVYFLVESSHTYLRAGVPVTVEVACNSPGRAEVQSHLQGQIWTPTDVERRNWKAV